MNNSDLLILAECDLEFIYNKKLDKHNIQNLKKLFSIFFTVAPFVYNIRVKWPQNVYLEIIGYRKSIVNKRGNLI